MNLRTVLLVDDEQQILDTYRTILGGDERDADLDELASIVGLEDESSEGRGPQKEAFRLLEATQGEEALQKQREAISAGTPPAVALVDMRMPPGINGLETSIRLRQQDPSIHIIIIITAYSDVESHTIQLALQHDFIFLKKPVVPEELHQIVVNAANAYQLAISSTRKEIDPPLYLDQMTQQQVLVVDDEPMMLKLAEAILLQYLQVKVITATTGQEALQLAHTLSPDLILLDVKMSGMDGYTVCRALKASDDTKDIPVMFVTAQSGDDHVIEGFNAGAVDYISKPFSKPILVARVSTHLSLYRNSRRLKMLSNTDMLTDLPNRAAFQTYLDMRLRDADAASAGRREEDSIAGEPGHFALLFIDLDHFKPVNDELGHEVGDLLLQAVAGRLRKNVREVDLLARIGGDEFVLMLGGRASQEQVALIADKMVNLLCQPFHLDGGHTVQIGASIGSARYPEDAANGDELLRNADMAMYEAKAEGRSCHVSFSKEFEGLLTQREQLAAELRKAIEENQLDLLYQPIVRLESREIIGTDALLRWNHPVRGAVQASEFITVLMEGRLGEMAEDWTLRKTCRQLLEWHQNGGKTIPVNLGLSEERFNSNQLSQYISQLSSDEGLGSELLDQLVLEVSEELLMKHPDTSLHQLQMLNRIGARIILENFGSGRSSIRYLQKFPLNAVKLERSLVDQIGDPEADQLLIAALTLIRVLGYRAIAEGVESEAQLEFLLQQGCDCGSGDFLHPAQTGDEIAALLEKSS